jgi:hypothetical protein
VDITYVKTDEYYIFSHKPKVRVYLGEASPEDYIFDELEQAKRSATCYYVNKKTGQKVTSVNADFGFHDEHEFMCPYVFKRKLHLAAWGNFSTGKGVEYISSDKAMERLAVSYFLGQTLEQYDARQEQFRLEREEQKHKHPLLHNLMMVDGETYYVDDNGKRITFDEHVELMKAGGYL